jgi:transcriptional regulator with XRE-family HTH domain
MAEQRLTANRLLDRVLHTQPGVRLTRPTLSKIINDSYEGEPSALIVRGLAQSLDTTADYLLGLTDDRWPNAMAFARQYSLADEEQLLNWLAEQNAELAEIMRAIRTIPEEEQIAILDHLSDEVAFVRRMVARRSETNYDKHDQTF